MNRRISLPKSAKPRSDLALLLRFLRERIAPDACNLGPHRRHPSRLRKPVSQLELAEAIGVTREWYALLECGAASGASTGLLGRLADALMLTLEERASLFQSALPDLGSTQPRYDSILALESFPRLRSLSKRLWAATSVDDVLTTASEGLADWFDDALLVRSTRRYDSGVWAPRSVNDEQEGDMCARVIGEMKDLLLTSESADVNDLVLTSGLLDALNFHPRLANAGDLGSTGLYPLPLRREILNVYARHRFPPFAWNYARVRSRTGFIGGFYISHEFGHFYSASDLAVFGAFAEVASLALS
jgi:transcriptional regulator with XRE-family HTH domain